MNFCRDCKFRVGNFPARCGHPNAAVVDRETGEIKQFLCSIERSFTTAHGCGPAGTNFEALVQEGVA